MRKTLFLSLIMLLLLGCSKLRPYCVEVQQGNIIDQHAMEQLRLGLNKNEVRSILGASLLDGTSDTNTWTYVYTNQINGGKIEKKKIILTFKKNRLVKINQ
jgi:outer membrane protein assembly factor BamE